MAFSTPGFPYKDLDRHGRKTAIDSTPVAAFTQHCLALDVLLVRMARTKACSSQKIKEIKNSKWSGGYRSGINLWRLSSDQQVGRQSTQIEVEEDVFTSKRTPLLGKQEAQEEEEERRRSSRGSENGVGGQRGAEGGPLKAYD